MSNNCANPRQLYSVISPKCAKMFANGNKWREKLFLLSTITKCCEEFDLLFQNWTKTTEKNCKCLFSLCLSETLSSNYSQCVSERPIRTQHTARWAGVQTFHTWTVTLHSYFYISVTVSLHEEQNNDSWFLFIFNLDEETIRTFFLLFDLKYGWRH